MAYAYGVSPGRIKAHMAKANALEADLPAEVPTISIVPGRADGRKVSAGIQPRP
jgi:hypothetical protein